MSSVLKRLQRRVAVTCARTPDAALAKAAEYFQHHWIGRRGFWTTAA
jgi:hypothetical protein